MEPQEIADRIRVALSRRKPTFGPRSRPLAEVLDAAELDEATLRSSGLVRIDDDDEVHLLDTSDLPGAWKRRMQDGFDSALVRQLDSASYQAFVQAVYGSEYRFSPLDDGQVATMIGQMELRPGARFLDLGCAVGTLTARAARATGARGTGIDFAPSAIRRARADHPDLAFVVGDLDDLGALAFEPFDAAVAFDTLYFPLDLHDTLRQVATLLVPGGRLVASFTHRVAEGPVSDDPADSRLAQALDEGGWTWSAVDATEAGGAFWRRSAEVLVEMEERFRDQGDEDLWANIHAETSVTVEAYDADRVRRWLYAATPS